MPKNNPKRREAKRQQIVETLQEVSDTMHARSSTENSIKVLAEALIFILEDTCKKKL